MMKLSLVAAVAAAAAVVLPLGATGQPAADQQFNNANQATVVDGVTGANLRGTIATASDGNLIYGPFEAGFQAGFICSGNGGNAALPGGLDTLLTGLVAEHQCQTTGLQLLNDCGGHANPFHYHEHFTCLYEEGTRGHSTAAGTVTNGQKLYGKYEASGNVLPELDACNGHFGVTPDSNGKVVYHYHVTAEAPFSLGCVGPAVDSGGNHRLVTVEQCRAVYPTCDGDTTAFDTAAGTVVYDLDCPCYDEDESNHGGINPIQYASSAILEVAAADTVAPSAGTGSGVLSATTGAGVPSTTAECQEYADAMGVVYVSETTCTAPECAPRGCYVWSNLYAYWNDDKVGDCTTTRRCVFSSAANAPDATTEEDTAATTTMATTAEGTAATTTKATTEAFAATTAGSNAQCSERLAALQAEIEALKARLAARAASCSRRGRRSMFAS